VRRLAALVVAGAALWLAPGALASGWCGTGEQANDAPDIVTGRQIHPIVVIPSDGVDNFAAAANRLADDVTSMTAWWAGQDPTRAPRFDQAGFPGGTCLDISFLRLPDSSATLRGGSAAFSRVVGTLESAGFASTYKKYYVYYDGPSVQDNVCGTGGGNFSTGPGFSIVWLSGCPGVGTDAVGAHELIHALGALPAGAPHACPGDSAHPCDSPFVDVLSPQTDGRPLQQQVLDVNHDDYYAHSGAWDDLQDSGWLSHLDAAHEPLAVAMSGGSGRVWSDLPGVDCTVACTTQWDQGSIVTLFATPNAGSRFIRWTGPCAGNSSCAVTLAEAQSVTAVFGPERIPVKVTLAGRGAVRCTPVCSRSFPAGDPITLRAVPAKGWKFAGWSGGCKGTRLVCRPATGTAVTVRATFRRKPVTKK
jgi:hypothetical protein